MKITKNTDSSKNYPLYLNIRNLVGRIEKIEGSSDRYLVADESNKKVISAFDKLWKFIKDEINRLIKKMIKLFLVMQIII